VVTVLWTIYVIFAVALIYWIPVRRWYRYWGATEAEIRRTMPGDELVPRTTYETTLAVTINAPPADIWPWLVQMGYGRGGLYSYDSLDCFFGYLDAPSADRILPEFQRLEVGDIIPIGRGEGFPVKVIDPFHTLVLGAETRGFQWVWQFGLYPVDERTTRLLSRNRANIARTHGSILFTRILEPAAFLMTRKTLLGLKRRAESARVRSESRAMPPKSPHGPAPLEG
jgi:hypothetical protein